jgi:hypothetical protein
VHYLDSPKPQIYLYELEVRDLDGGGVDIPHATIKKIKVGHLQRINAITQQLHGRICSWSSAKTS